MSTTRANSLGREGGRLIAQARPRCHRGLLVTKKSIDRSPDRRGAARAGAPRPIERPLRDQGVRVRAGARGIDATPGARRGRAGADGRELRIELRVVPEDALQVEREPARGGEVRGDGRLGGDAIAQRDQVG